MRTICAACMILGLLSLSNIGGCNSNSPSHLKQASAAGSGSSDRASEIRKLTERDKDRIEHPEKYREKSSANRESGAKTGLGDAILRMLNEVDAPSEDRDALREFIGLKDQELAKAMGEKSKREIIQAANKRRPATRIGAPNEPPKRARGADPKQPVPPVEPVKPAPPVEPANPAPGVEPPKPSSPFDPPLPPAPTVEPAKPAELVPPATSELPK